MAEIAIAAGTSKASFYTYFSNVPAVLLAASSDLLQSTPEVMRIAQAEWSNDNCVDLSLKLVRVYVAFWSAHRAVLRARNLAAEEGAPAFVNARARAVRPLLAELTRKLAEAQSMGRVDTRALPSALAATLLMMLERLGALSPGIYREEAASHDELIIAAATMIRSSLGW